MMGCAWWRGLSHAIEVKRGAFSGSILSNCVVLAEETSFVVKLDRLSPC
jgi:hypothetical protein